MNMRMSWTGVVCVVALCVLRPAAETANTANRRTISRGTIMTKANGPGIPFHIPAAAVSSSVEPGRAGRSDQRASVPVTGIAAAGQPHPPTPPHTTKTTTTTTFNDARECRETRNCSACLAAVISQLDRVGCVEAPRAIMTVSASVPACRATIAGPNPAALYNEVVDHVQLLHCDLESWYIFESCLPRGFACLSDPPCDKCFSLLLAKNETKHAIYDSPTCRATAANATAYTELADAISFCALGVCTFNRAACEQSAACARGLRALQVGDVKAALLACPVGSSDADLLTLVLTKCTSQEATDCAYLEGICVSDGACKSCYEAMLAKYNASPCDVAEAWLGPHCRKLRDSSPYSPEIMRLQWLVQGACPHSMVSPCGVAAGGCVMTEPQCSLCLAGTAEERADPSCKDLLKVNGLLTSDPDSPCRPCPASVDRVNVLVVTTAAVGAVSLVACLAVVVAILAYKRDVTAMRDRIILNLMMANAVYSAANTVPMHLLSTSVPLCGELVLSTDTIRAGRALWFAGKYALVGFELYILGVSVAALRRGGRSTSRILETVLHLCCWGLGAAAFAVFWMLCDRINRAGYNSATQEEAASGAISHIGADDDIDDDGWPVVSKAMRDFSSARNSYDDLLRWMLLVWDGFLGVALLMWLGLRIAYHRAVRSWRAHVRSESSAEAADDWALTRQSIWNTRRERMHAEREEYLAISKPLVPYVFVFLLFAPPAILMSTSYCQHQSSTTESINGPMNEGATLFTYGQCNLWCELALAFRSLATVAVFLLPRDRRVELTDVRLLWSKLRNRLRCWCATDKLTDSQDSVGSTDSKAARHSRSPNASLSWWLAESDVKVTRRIGQGSCGEVWEGQLRGSQLVAVKVFFAKNNRDSLSAAFAKECTVLQKLQHPNLLRFYGCGISDSHRFIATELMSGGSLRDFFRNAHTSNELPPKWHTRFSIALQVASGMAHLHAMPIVHRDLKSDNVLLDASGRAVVGDFGTSRHFRARPEPEVIVSAFTGSSRKLSGQSGVISVARPVTDVARVSVGVMDTDGTMTRIAGTLLWMAPEVFRGDSSYGAAVDVYSFGVLLWEIAVATGEVPWEAELDYTSDTIFCQRLAQALQTGKRPTIPPKVDENVPKFSAILQQCWAGDAADRPSFVVVLPELAACLREARSANEE